ALNLLIYNYLWTYRPGWHPRSRESIGAADGFHHIWRGRAERGRCAGQRAVRDYASMKPSIGLVCAALAASGWIAAEGSSPMTEIRFMTLDPGHFHAALVLKEMYPGVSRKVDVYAPLGPDLLDHLARVSRFNLRNENPTAWDLEVHAGPDFFERMRSERPGNVVVISGRNRGKIERIQGALDAGLHALVDKPWILEADDLPRLEAALGTAESKGLVALDIMTERFEITSEL